MRGTGSRLPRHGWMQIAPNSTLERFLRLPLTLISRETVVPVRAGLNRDARWIVGSSLHPRYVLARGSRGSHVGGYAIVEESRSSEQ
jgi:hypothetical protein